MKTVLILLGLIILSPESHGQDWGPVGSGVDWVGMGGVRVLAVHSGKLCVAGLIDQAGGQPVHNIAAWDGSIWSNPFGTGTNYQIIALAEFNGNLIAGGEFTNAGGNPAYAIAEWNGTNWLNLGSGMNRYDRNKNAAIYALTVYNGELYAGGDIDSAGGQHVNYIAKWNGSSWAPVGFGTNGIVQAMVVYNGELYVGGFFTSAGGNPVNNIAKWNGTSWATVGTGTATSISTLSVYGNKLIAGNAVNQIGVEQWDGTSWNPLGAGIGPSANYPVVYAATPYGGSLVVGGSFTTAGAANVSNVALWDSTNWYSVGNGSAPGLIHGPSGPVYALTVYNGILYAGGCFTMATTGTQQVIANYIARWNGNTGIDEVSSSPEVALFPNPNNGNFGLRYNCIHQGKFEIFTVEGRLTYSMELSPGKNGITISTDISSSGLYLWKLSDSSTNCSGKMTIIK
jgi:hypothetical protein